MTIPELKAKVADLSRQVAEAKQTVDVIRESDGDAAKVARQLGDAEALYAVLQTRHAKALRELNQRLAAEVEGKLSDALAKARKAAAACTSEREHVREVLLKWYDPILVKHIMEPGECPRPVLQDNNDSVRLTMREKELRALAAAAQREVSRLEQELAELTR